MSGEGPGDPYAAVRLKGAAPEDPIAAFVPSIANFYPADVLFPGGPAFSFAGGIGLGLRCRAWQELRARTEGEENRNICEDSLTTYLPGR